MKKAYIPLLFACILMLLSQPLIARTKIAWFTSMNENEKALTGFWITTRTFIQAAAEDLDVDLKIYYANRDYFLMVQKAKNVMSNPETRPDGIMFHNYKKQGENILKLAEQHGVRSLIFNAGFGDDENPGVPRGKYRQWIGQMTPDDKHAGYLLAVKLMKEAAKANKLGADGKIHAVALEGNRASQASNARIQGFKRALEENDQVVNRQFFHSKWKETFAQEAFNATSQRYPAVSLFWAASESMAIGVIKGARELGWKPGKDFVTGGVDLLSKNMPYLLSNEMAVSVGGHYVEGAFALIALYDYLNGYDFAGSQSTKLKTKMLSLTGAELKKIGDLRTTLTSQRISRFDFSKLSKKHHPELKQYDLDIKKIIEQL